jgi:KaiC/GvpD/RAD55 family RecA-like ATPase
MKGTGAGAVVVGVADGEAGQAALGIAFREGVRRGARVLVVTTWQPAQQVSRQAGDIETRAGAQELQDRQVSRGLDTAVALPVVSRLIREGDAAAVLTALSRNAELLVIGSPQGLAWRLGDVGRRALAQSTCGVVLAVVKRRHPAPTDEPNAAESEQT